MNTTTPSLPLSAEQLDQLEAFWNEAKSERALPCTEPETVLSLIAQARTAQQATASRGEPAATPASNTRATDYIMEAIESYADTREESTLNRIRHMVAEGQNAIEAGLEAASRSCKLVPIKPTDAMLRAGQDAWLKDPARRSSTLYRAMLAAAPTAAIAEADAKDAEKDDEWSFSTDEENYHEQEHSRIAIIRHALGEVEARDDGAPGFWIGRNVRFVGQIDAGWIIEQLQEQAYDECGEWAETYLEGVTKDEEAELEALVNAWAARVDRSNFWTVKDTEYIAVEDAREIVAATQQAQNSAKGDEDAN